MKVYIVIIVIFINNVLSETLTGNGDVWKDGIYTFNWSIDTIAETITMNLDCKSSGWVGVGFSPDGTMEKADMIIGYIDTTGKAVVNDRYAKGSYAPDLDTTLGGKDDLTNISGSLSNGRTKISFTRKLDTGDQYDHKFTKGESVNLIFAFRTNGNPSTENGVLNQHSQVGGAKLVLYQTSSGTTTTTDSNVMTIDIKLEKVAVPNKSTIYMCKMFKVDELLAASTGNPKDTPYHAIQYDPIIGSPSIVHHVLMYSCGAQIAYIPETKECGLDMNPGCYEIIALFGMGTSSYSLPTDVGLQWGTNKGKLVWLEIHYDNPTNSSTFVDTSGFKVHFTKSLRKYNLGIMTLGKSMEYIQIPAGQTNATIVDTCSAGCTNMFRNDGIKLITTFLHGHRLLKKIRTEIYFADGRVDTTSMRDDTYSFNNQYINTFNAPIAVKQGDSLKTICEYDTTAQTNVTLGGEQSNNEMCYNFVAYYPMENGLFFCEDNDGHPLCVPTVDISESYLRGIKLILLLSLLMFML